MYCSNCGKQIADGSKFCPECGASQTGAAPQQPVINVVNQNTNVNKVYGYRPKSKWLAFFLCLRDRSRSPTLQVDSLPAEPQGEQVLA